MGVVRLGSRIASRFKSMISTADFTCAAAVEPDDDDGRAEDEGRAVRGGAGDRGVELPRPAGDRSPARGDRGR